MINDLEMWLIGTPAELDQATTAATAAIGRNLDHSGAWAGIWQEHPTTAGLSQS